MGMRLARAAWQAPLTDLSDRARLVLQHMCWMARDSATGDEPGKEYWAGHIAIGMFLFGLERGGSKSAQELVRRAIRELTDAGLIVKIGGGQKAERAHYLITVEGWQPPLPACGKPTPGGDR